MSTFEWERQYTLGIEAIDTQHKMIMEKFNELQEAINKRKEQEMISQLIVALIEYSKLHFRDEEDLFAKNKYPKAGAQKIAHLNFTKEAEDFYRAYVRDPMLNPLPIIAFLKDWIENHMLTLDMEYKEFIEKMTAIKKLKEG
jgi:hemerythrin-like metal-binding protein